MPTPPLFPVSQISFALPIMQAVKAMFEADPNFEVGGNLGIRSISIAQSIPDGNELILDWIAVGKCPGISIWCKPDGSSRKLIQTEALRYEIEIYMFVEHNRRRTGGYENQQTIVESAMRKCRETITQFPNSFVEGTQLQLTGEGSQGEFERAQTMQRRDVSKSTIPLIALHSESAGD